MRRAARVVGAGMTSESSSLELPEYVEWPLFPFEVELRVKTPMVS
jgi:hypothetical protein